jgi:hypothetical protein
MNAASQDPGDALLRNLLERVRNGEVSVDEAMPQVRLLGERALLAGVTTSRRGVGGNWIFGLVFALIGTVFVGVGGGMGWRSVQFLGAPQADGVVVAVDRGIPTAKYKVKDVEYEVRGAISSKPPAFRVGDKVAVLYNPDKPGDAQIDSFVERWLFLLVFGGLGAVFASIGWGLLIALILGRVARAWQAASVEPERFTIE